MLGAWEWNGTSPVNEKLPPGEAYVLGQGIVHLSNIQQTTKLQK